MTKFKIVTIITAISMALYAFHIMIHNIQAVVRLCCTNFHGHPFIRDMYYAAWMYLSLGVMITTLIAILRMTSASSTVPTKSFRILTYILTIITIFAMMGGSLPFPVYVSGIPFMYVPISWRIIVIFIATAWLWMLSRQSGVGTISTPLRIAMMIGIGALALPILTQFISATSYLLTGELLFLRSWAIYSWVRIFIPTILLCWYSIELFKRTN